MKSIKLILLSFLISFAACKNNIDAPAKAIEPKVEEENPQWISYEGKADMPKIVLVSGDEEYRSEEALPQLAKILTERHGFNTKVLFAQDPAKPGIMNPNYLHNIPGLESLADADLMVMFLRFRALPDDQMKHIDDYLKTGKPVIGLRTSTHAFNFKEEDETSYRHYGNYYDEDDEWKDGFGRLVLGEKWISHHGHHRHQSTVGIPAAEADGHPILNGIGPGDAWAPSDVYGVRLPLPGDSQAILYGQVTNRAGEYDENDPLYGMRATDSEVAKVNSARKDDMNPNDPMMPVAWTKSYQIPGGKKGKAFASTMGASTDMLSEGTRRLLVNAVYWTLGKDVPAKADVSVVGEYAPTAFAFTKEGFWEGKNVPIAIHRK